MHRLRSFLVAGETPVPSSPLVEKASEGKAHPEELLASDIRRKDRRHSNHRNEARYRLTEERVTVIYQEEEREAGLLNLSAGGAMIETDLVPEVNDSLRIRFQDCLPLELTVRWVADGRIGLEFSDETEIVMQYIEQSGGLEDRRFGPERRANTFRHGVFWEGELCTDDDGVDIRLRNISGNGAMIRAEEERDWIRIGAEVELDLGIAGCIKCQIRWCRGPEIGLLFEREFDLRRLSKDEGIVASEHAWVRPEYLRTKNLPKDRPAA